MKKLLNIQMFAAEGKTKLQKHIDELEEIGASNDAVTFKGKNAFDLLKSMIGLKKKAGDAGEEDADEDPDAPAPTGEDQGTAKNASSVKKSVRNGGDIEDADEDPDDPAQTGNDAKGGSIIANKGKKISKEGSPAVKHYEFDEDRFEKSMEQYEEVLDASEAVADLAKSVSTIGQAHNVNAALIKSVSDQQVVIAGALVELMKSTAEMAADLKLLKKQPATAPAPGFVVMQKKSGDDSSNGGAARLVKSDIQDVLTDALNNGHEEAAGLMKRLGVIYSQDQESLADFVENVLPEDIKANL